MGKNKKKTNSIFKVAGAKSLKLKAKAKEVKGDLKQINLKNQKKVTEINKQLAELEETVRQSKSTQQAETNKKRTNLPAKKVSPEVGKNSQEALDKLNCIKL